MDVADIEDLTATDDAAQHRLPRSLVARHAKPAAVAVPNGVRGEGQANIWVKTFGCSHNASDGEYMAGMLASYGYK